MIKDKYLKLMSKLKFFKKDETFHIEDKETWNLDVSLAKLILPRLIKFNQLRNGCPMSLTETEWSDCLNQMIEAFEWYSGENRWNENEFEMMQKHQKGIDLFAKYYNCLWW